MSEPQLKDVIDRLDRLEAALHKLIAVVERNGGALAAPAAAAVSVAEAPVEAPSASQIAFTAVDPGPPPIRVAPPKRTPAPTAHRPEERNAEPTRDYDPYRDRTDLVVPGPQATIADVLARVFEAGLMEDAEDTWALMSKLTHSSQLRGPRALDHFKAFAWHKIRRTTAGYLAVPGNARSFTIAYTEPPQLTPDVQRVKVFVQTPDGRLPVPISFARDPEDVQAWRVTQVSL